jgi:hypothetical protein
MSEQNQPEEQKRPAKDETAGTASTGSNTNSQTGHSAEEQSKSSGADPEQTGEGTGAKAGEYS